MHEFVVVNWSENLRILDLTRYNTWRGHPNLEWGWGICFHSISRQEFRNRFRELHKFPNPYTVCY